VIPVLSTPSPDRNIGNGKPPLRMWLLTMINSGPISMNIVHTTTVLMTVTKLSDESDSAAFEDDLCLVVVISDRSLPLLPLNRIVC
jgi:hypothetical protein